MKKFNGRFKEIRLKQGNVEVTLDWIGEGWDGDYNPDSVENDEPLLRFDVYQNGEPVDNASYCTRLRATDSRNILKRAVQVIMNEVYEPLLGGNSIKKTCECLSWLEIGDFKK